jgi:hypothetical protein
VLTFASGGGVHVDTSGLADPRSYTIVFRFRLADLGTGSPVSKRLVSWFPTTGTGAESGLYTYRLSGMAAQLEYYSELDREAVARVEGEVDERDLVVLVIQRVGEPEQRLVLLDLPPATITASRAPKVTGSGSKLTVDTGIVAGCPAGSQSCPVTAAITSNATGPRAARRMTLGKLKTSIKPGAKKKVSVKLSKKGARLLRRAKHLKVKIVVVVVGPDKRAITTRRRVTLKSPH